MQVKHPLLIVALCATGAVAVLSGVAVAAFAAPVATQTSAVRGVAALSVPLDHHPAHYTSPLAPAANRDRNLLVVPVAGAKTVDGALPIAVGSPPVPASTAGSTGRADHPSANVPPSESAPGVATSTAPAAIPESPSASTTDDTTAADKPDTVAKSGDSHGSGNSGTDNHGQQSSNSSGDSKSGKKDK
jgi:hypothetical protein